MNHIGFDAMEYAIYAHGDQRRDRNGLPFVIHPIRVGNLLYQLYGDAHLAAAGYLHDVLEDTDVTEQDLREAGFGGWIIERVKDVTKVPGEPWPYPTNKDSVRLKCADTYDNVMDNFRDKHTPRRDKVAIWRNLHDYASEHIHGETILDMLDKAINHFE